MQEIDIRYEIEKGCFKIGVIKKDVGFSFKERVFPKDYYKEGKGDLYNDILDFFELDGITENIEFYNSLDKMCLDILTEIKEEQ
jgi:hypothetical protein